MNTVGKTNHLDQKSVCIWKMFATSWHLALRNRNFEEKLNLCCEKRFQQKFMFIVQFYTSWFETITIIHTQRRFLQGVVYGILTFCSNVILGDCRSRHFLAWYNEQNSNSIFYQQNTLKTPFQNKFSDNYRPTNAKLSSKSTFQ